MNDASAVAPATRARRVRKTRILLPSDGSGAALHAASFVCMVLKDAAERCEVTLAHVDEPFPAHAERAVGAAAARALHEDASTRAIERARRLLARYGIPYRTAFRVGDAGTELAACAQSIRAELVVMGARGVGAFRAFVLGSTSQRVLAACPVPAIIVRRAPVERPVASALVATDGSDASLRAIRALLRLRHLWSSGLRVVVAHVVKPVSERAAIALGLGPQDDYYAAVAAAAMKPARVLLHAGGVRCEEMVLIGSPGKRIAEVATARDFDLVVLGTRGRGAGGALVFGSVAQRVLAECPAPALVVH